MIGWEGLLHQRDGVVVVHLEDKPGPSQFWVARQLAASSPQSSYPRHAGVAPSSQMIGGASRLLWCSLHRRSTQLTLITSEQVFGARSN
ncbi:hypothetical protein PFISCL1PPCAC_11517, partial [Pristionchus fissidentatus]